MANLACLAPCPHTNGPKHHDSPAPTPWGRSGGMPVQGLPTLALSIVAVKARDAQSSPSLLCTSHCGCPMLQTERSRTGPVPARSLDACCRNSMTTMEAQVRRHPQPRKARTAR